MKNPNYNHYDYPERLSIIRDYYESGKSKYFIVKKYKISQVSVFSSWLKKYEIDEKELLLWSESAKEAYMSSKKKSKSVASTDAVDASSHIEQIHNLEMALAYAQKQILALNVLIDVAERNEGISIRKKAGAKQ